MIKKLFFCLFLLTAVTSHAQTITPDALRREYEHATKDSATCGKLYKKLIKSSNADNITTAYRGAVTMAWANHAKTKKEKLSLFSEGKKLLEKAITAENSNIEMRFLRFSIQSNAPKALGYIKQMTEDKAFMLQNYNATENAVVKRMISTFAQQSSAFTESEKQKLK